MISVCLYFQVHQPFRLRRDYNFFKIGRDHQYEDPDFARQMICQVAERCYLPANALLLELIRRHEGEFRVCFSLTGTVIEQLRDYAPAALAGFQQLAATGQVELLDETYYHALAFLYSRDEFRAQVAQHRQLMKDLFDCEPTCFRNTELIYNNDLAREVEALGYQAVLTEGANQILGWRSPNFVYQPAPSYKLKLLLNNYRLADDLAFRFADRGWDQYPLTPAKYAGWIHRVAGNGEVVNLFLDYGTFGERQAADTGIFEFLRGLPAAVLARPDFGFRTPSEVAAAHQPMAKIDVPHTISWADVERDLTAWVGNPMQDSALEYLYSLREPVLNSGDDDLIRAWQHLQSSDHFYYMCTKWFSDGDVHRYFNPFASPHDAYVVYINVLNDIQERLRRLGKAGKK